MILYIDITNRRFVEGYTSTIPGFVPRVVQGDSVGLELHFLKANPGAANPYEYVDMSAASVKVAVGRPGTTPTGGVFKFVFGGDTTDGLPYNASASDVQSALNALTSIDAAGGVVVTGQNGGPYRITFNTPGIRQLIAVETDTLSPTSYAIAFEASNASSEAVSVQEVRISQFPAASTSDFSKAPDPSPSVTQLVVGASDARAVQKFSFGRLPYSGTFLISSAAWSTRAIQFDANQSVILEALNAASGGEFDSVVVSPDGSFSATWSAVGEQDPLVLDISGLKFPEYLSGEIDLNTNGIEALVGTNPTAQAVLEVQVYRGFSTTYAQAPITISNDLIEDAPTEQVPVEPFASEEFLKNIAVPTGKLVFVSTSGTDDRTGLSKYNLYKPFATLYAAVTAAEAGDTVVVLGGIFEETNILAKDGVDWFFMPGTGFIHTGSNAPFANFGSAMSYKVRGYGEFTKSGNALMGVAAGSDIFFEAKKVQVTSSGFSVAGGLTLSCPEIVTTTECVSLIAGGSLKILAGSSLKSTLSRAVIASVVGGTTVLEAENVDFEGSAAAIQWYISDAGFSVNLAWCRLLSGGTESIQGGDTAQDMVIHHCSTNKPFSENVNNLIGTPQIVEDAAI